MTGSSDPAPIVNVDGEVDARRLLCPLPLLRLDAAMRRMAPGQILRLRATDPGLGQDLPAWCRINGHALLALTTMAPEVIGYVRKG